jgi:hypothetical protein
VVILNKVALIPVEIQVDNVHSHPEASIRLELGIPTKIKVVIIPV